jgi:hypothetical protein
MKRTISLSILILCLLFLSGCWVYGKGETVGYIYAVDDGIFWDKVWYKSSLESSESDCYLLKDDNIKQQLRDLPNGIKVKLSYDRHFITIASCPEGTDTEDEINGFEIVTD